MIDDVQWRSPVVFPKPEICNTKTPTKIVKLVNIGNMKWPNSVNEIKFTINVGKEANVTKSQYGTF